MKSEDIKTLNASTVERLISLIRVSDAHPEFVGSKVTATAVELTAIVHQMSFVGEIAYQLAVANERESQQEDTLNRVMEKHRVEMEMMCKNRDATYLKNLEEMQQRLRILEAHVRFGRRLK